MECPEDAIRRTGILPLDLGASETESKESDPKYTPTRPKANLFFSRGWALGVCCGCGVCCIDCVCLSGSASHWGVERGEDGAVDKGEFAQVLGDLEEQGLEEEETERVGREP